MPAEKATIAALFARDQASFESILDVARKCAALTKPWMLPPKSQSANQSLPENYQSIGSHGMTNLEGRALMSLFPYGVPWFVEELDPKIRYAPDVDPLMLRELENRLFLRSFQIQSTLESASDEYLRRLYQGFRTAKRMSLSQLFITGDTLERMNDDFSLTVFRRDHYVVKRDTSGAVLYIATKETKDPLELDEAQYKAAKLPDDWADKDVCDRMVDLWSLSKWNPQSKTYVVTQEINGNEIHQAEQPGRAPSYNATPFELVPGEHVGRGFVEQNRGDLRSLDVLGERVLDFAALASNHKIFVDAGSNIRWDDLAKPTGSIVPNARVVNGVLQDVAFGKVDKVQDFSVVNEVKKGIEGRLGAAMLIASQSVRDSERTTQFEVAEVTLRELEGVLGGLYAPIADNMQIPVFNRTAYLLEKNKTLTPLPNGSVQRKLLTGIAALTAARKSQELVEFYALAAQGGEGTLARIDPGVYLEELAKQKRINVPGLIKTAKQMREEQQAAIRLQAQQEANSKAIDVAGNAIEGQAAAATAQRTSTNA